MKKTSMKCLTIVLGIALTLLFAGAIMQGVNISSSSFNLGYLADAMATVGLIGAVLSGIALVALTIVRAVQCKEEDKK